MGRVRQSSVRSPARRGHSPRCGLATVWAALLFAASLTLASGCGDDAALEGGSNGEGVGGDRPGQGVDTGNGGGGQDAGQPPEQEESFELQAPRASRTFVFVANTTLNSVAKIDSLSLEVTPIDVCLEPIEVRTLPTYDRAVVLCRGDDRIAIIDAADGDDDEVRDTWAAEGLNRLLLAPNGDYALAWYDSRLTPLGGVDPNEEPGNPNDLVLVRLGDVGDAPESYLLSVGFGVREVDFDAAGETAFVTTEDGLNVIELDAVEGDQFVPVLSIGDDPLARADDREVHVTDDGALAFVRASTFAGLRILEIETGALADVALPSVPTDLDLFRGGDRGVAVLRDTEQIALLPLPEAFDDPALVEIVELPGRPMGLAQVAPESESLLLYTTLGSSLLTVLDLDALSAGAGVDAAATTLDLRKHVAGVIMAPVADRALVLHSRTAGAPVAGEPIDDFIAKSPGYSLLDVETGFARLVLSDADPDDLVFTDDGRQAFVMIEEAAAGVRTVQWVDFDSFRVESFEMARPPESVGIVPATGRVYVSQEAETGRITFIDTETGRQQHVTAYQLNRRIE